jgi:multidrug resistance efflux pump
VRLAQRIPVRINIDHVPKDVTIAAGQTCTIVITPPRPEDNRQEGPALAP